jgi:hypothetical protein
MHKLLSVLFWDGRWCEWRVWWSFSLICLPSPHPARSAKSGMVGGVDGESVEEEVVVHTRSITNTQTCY